MSGKHRFELKTLPASRLRIAVKNAEPYNISPAENTKNNLTNVRSDAAGRGILKVTRCRKAPVGIYVTAYSRDRLS